MEGGIRAITADRVSDLRDALGRGEFVMAYQPIVDAHSRRLVALEVLVRRRRGRVVELPAEFLGDIELGGLQHHLAARVFMTGLSDLRRLRAGGLVAPDVRLHVNVSAAQLDDPARIDEVESCARRLGLPHEALTVELTESCALHDPGLAAVMLGRCREKGVPVALDDVGAGYASLALLRTIPVDELKIDGSFVVDVAHSATCQAIVAGIVEITRRLGLVSTAEGVETPEQDRVLRELGVDRLQGHLHGRPMAYDELRAHLVAMADTGPGREPARAVRR